MSTAQSLEARIRAAERRVADSYGLTIGEHMITLDDPSVRVRVLTIGSGPPVLSVNGIATPGMGFAPLIARLPGFRHLLLELPGHGLSAPCRWQGRSVRESAVRIVTGTLDALELPRVAMIGSSLGGLFALAMSLDAPARLSQATILGTPATALPGCRPIPSMAALASPIRGPIEQRLAALASPRFAARIALAEAMGSAAAQAMSNDMLDLHRLPLRLPGQAASYRALIRRLIQGRDPRPENILTTAELTRIATPLLFLWGRQDAFCPPEQGRRSVERIPGARFEIVPGAHTPWLDDADHCAAMIRTVLPEPVAPTIGASRHA